MFFLFSDTLFSDAGLCLFDMSATLVNGIGLTYVSASAVQMLRGSMVFFTGMNTVIILKRKLSNGQWGGIMLVVLALAMVGASATLRERM